MPLFSYLGVPGSTTSKKQTEAELLCLVKLELVGGLRTPARRRTTSTRKKKTDTRPAVANGSRQVVFGVEENYLRKKPRQVSGIMSRSCRRTVGLLPELVGCRRGLVGKGVEEYYLLKTTEVRTS